MVVNAESVASFEGRLDKFWSAQDLRYNYKAQRINASRNTATTTTTTTTPNEVLELETHA